MITEPKGFIYDIHQKMKTHNVLLAFTGAFDLKIINALILSVKMKLYEVESATKIQKRVYNIMVECLEAVIRNYEIVNEKGKPVNAFAVFTLGKAEGYYYLISGNYIGNEYVDQIKGKIDRINKMNDAERKEMYLKILTDSKLERYNSDLALVDIAIKSNSALEYEFKRINDQTSFYLFEVKIKTT